MCHFEQKGIRLFDKEHLYLKVVPKEMEAEDD